MKKNIDLKIVATGTLALLTITLVFAYIISPLFESPEVSYPEIPIFLWGLTLILIAPLLETAIQHLYFKLLESRLPIWILLVGFALLFAAFHAKYNIYYFSKTVCSGLTYGLIYFMTKKRKYNPYWTTASCHALHNGILFVLFELF